MVEAAAVVIKVAPLPDDFFFDGWRVVVSSARLLMSRSMPEARGSWEAWVRSRSQVSISARHAFSCWTSLSLSANL